MSEIAELTVTEILGIKLSVRVRDGFCCTKCGMTNDAHVATYGRSLNVHRLVPGSVYAIDGCVTLCLLCHKKAHVKINRERPASVTQARLVELRAMRERRTRAWLDLVARAANARGLNTAQYVQAALREKLKRDGFKPEKYP